VTLTGAMRLRFPLPTTVSSHTGRSIVPKTDAFRFSRGAHRAPLHRIFIDAPGIEFVPQAPP
jgi:hypothetical protein